MHILPGRLFLLLSLLACLAGSPAFAEEEAPGAFPIFAATDTDSLKAKEGQKIAIWGETTGSGKSNSGTNFVNFKDAEFYLVTFKSDLEPFKDAEPADAYDGERLVVTGVVSVYKDKPQVKLTSPNQVRILADDEAWPKAAPVAEPTTKPSPAPGKKPDPVTSAEEPRKKPPVDPKLYFK